MSVVTAKVPVSREPVFSFGLDVIGYQLNAPGFDFTEGGSAALYESLTSGGIEEIVGDHLAFMPLTPGLLADDLWQSIPPSTVIFGLPGGTLSGALSDSVSALLSKGYSFVLPDRASAGQLDGQTARSTSCNLT
jgi:c-di-GMP-related signal transduction protein